MSNVIISSRQIKNYYGSMNFIIDEHCKGKYAKKNGCNVKSLLYSVRSEAN